MAKKKKPKPFEFKEPADPGRSRRKRQLYLNLILAGMLISGLGAGYYYAEQYVAERTTVPSTQMLVVLKRRPPWMNDFLVEQIAMIARPTGVHSAFDQDVLSETAARLEHNPWVRTVHSVRRAYTNKPGDSLEIDCEYRAPAALVKWGSFYWLVDEKGVRLSDRFVDQDVPNIQFDPDGHTTLRVIEGVQQTVPHFAGEQWAGDDLQAGLKMANYLFGRSYTDQILRINVANAGGRLDPKSPQIVLGTKFQTQVFWGRPPTDADLDAFIEVSTARKLDYLRLAFEQFGRVDGKHKWLDIRFDRVTYPGDEETPPPPAPPAKPRRATH